MPKQTQTRELFFIAIRHSREFAFAMCAERFQIKSADYEPQRNSYQSRGLSD